MKFGETFDKNKLEGWKYIRYKALKNLIKASTTEVKQEETGKNTPHWSAIFLSQLILQIEDVNTFFLGMERMLQQRCQDYDKRKDLNGLMAKQISKLMKDLCSYVVLNYLAVLKITKKHDKHSCVTLMGEVKQTLFTSDFFLSLSNSSLFRNMNEMLRSIEPENDKSNVGRQCPICKESMNVGSTTLPCGHTVCWTCLAEATWKTHKQCPLCRKDQVVDPVNLEVTTILGGLSTQYFPINIDGELDEISDEEEEEDETKKQGKTTTTTSLATPANLLYSLPQVSTTTTKTSKKRRRKRKRPFGSIRCSKCNKFGLEEECCGAKYHVVIRVRRVPQHVRSALLKKAFNTYKEADEARLKIEQMYPKQSSSRKSRRKNSEDKMARKRETQKVSTTTTTTNGNTYHFPSPDFGALSGGDTISPIITGQSPRLRPSSFDLSNGRERGLSSSALSIGSTDSSSFNLDSNRLLEMNNLPGDAGDKDLVSDLYNQVMLAEARAHAAVQQANLNQLRYRTLEVKLAQTQKNLSNIITHITTPREGDSVKEEGPPRLRTQSMEWQLSSPRESPSKTSTKSPIKLVGGMSTKSPIKLVGGMPELSSEIFSLLDKDDFTDDFTELAGLGLY